LNLTYYFKLNNGIINSAKGVDIMPNIKPVSDLRNYNEVLKDIVVGDPVFLTKNGRGRYAIVDIEEYEKNQATIKLLSNLMAAEKAIKTGDEWLTEEQVEDDLGV
jgi:prevent-host-death family protein